MLKTLHLENVGPVSRLDVEFADRLNIFTGDNGLGKTFLLDSAWYCLFDLNHQLSPKGKRLRSEEPKFEYKIERSNSDGSTYCQSYQFEYESRREAWRSTDDSSHTLINWPSSSQAILGIYVKPDNNFSIIDSLRTKEPAISFDYADDDENIFPLEFSSNELWYGSKPAESDLIFYGPKLEHTILCNGLISDWVRWQNHPDQTTFSLFWQVIKRLFPASEVPTVGPTTRLSLKDVRDIPTLQFPYDQVPITHLSSGMKRIISLAYSLVWTWYEHRQAAALARVAPAKKLLLLIDEIELHLHPQWQRSIFPAIMDAIKLLDPHIQVQVLATTHSPLVLASLEPFFDEETDKLFGFELVDRDITLQEFPWAKMGDVDYWLTSPIFGLSRPRSRESEVAIDAAYAIMRRADMTQFPLHLQTQDNIHQELLHLLPDDDEFWHRWIVTADEAKIS
jgi:AAA domain, putative AbiEii toxin, Type IV TA system